MRAVVCNHQNSVFIIGAPCSVFCVSFCSLTIRCVLMRTAHSERKLKSQFSLSFYLRLDTHCKISSSLVQLIKTQSYCPFTAQILKMKELLWESTKEPFFFFQICMFRSADINWGEALSKRVLFVHT